MNVVMEGGQCNQLTSFEERVIPSSSHGAPKVPGAYILEHNDGLYVGSTNDLYHRNIQHRHSLKAGIHKNKALQSAYDANPEYAYKVIVTETREDAFKIEQNVIDQHMDSGLLFNVALDAKVANKGLVRSEEVVRKASEIRKGARHSADHKTKIMLNSPKRVEVTVNGVEYPSAKTASLALGIHDQTVTRRVNSDDPKYSNWIRTEDAPDVVIVVK